MRLMARYVAYTREHGETRDKKERMTIGRSLSLLACLSTLGWMLIGGVILAVGHIL